MHELVKALSKLTPFCFSRVTPGRFSLSQPSGKCWIARSWSVRNTITFLTGRDCEVAFRPACRNGPATAAYFKSSLRVIRFLAPEFRPFLLDDFMMALLKGGVEASDMSPAQRRNYRKSMPQTCCRDPRSE